MPRASKTSMSNEERRTTAFKIKLSARDSRAESSLRTRTWLLKKGQEKDKKRTENERRRNRYARVRRYRITSTLGLLLCGDPQDGGLRRLQPGARWSKLDYFDAGITSTRLHRPPSSRLFNALQHLSHWKAKIGMLCLSWA